MFRKKTVKKFYTTLRRRIGRHTSLLVVWMMHFFWFFIIFFAIIRRQTDHRRDASIETSLQTPDRWFSLFALHPRLLLHVPRQKKEHFRDSTASLALACSCTDAYPVQGDNRLTGTGDVGFIFSVRDPLWLCLCREFTQDRFEKQNNFLSSCCWTHFGLTFKTSPG